MDKERLEKVKEADVHFQGSAPVEERTAFGRLLDKMISPEARDKVKQGFDMAMRVGVVVSGAVLVTALSVHSMHAQTTDALNQLAQTQKQEVVMKAYDGPMHSSTQQNQNPQSPWSQHLLDVFDELATQKREQDERDSAIEDMAMFNSMQSFNAAKVLDYDPVEESRKAMSDMGVMIADTDISSLALDEYRDRIADDPAMSQRSKGPSQNG